jgi:glycosyltransferase involved in cell wall biosynthesis
MRVTLVSHQFPPDWVGGVERYTEALAAQLTRGGDAVTVVARRFDPAVPAVEARYEPLPDGARVVRLAGGAPGADGDAAGLARLERLFTGVVLDSAPDVVHVNHLIHLSPRFVEIAHRLGAAVVLTLHDYYFACPLIRLHKASGDLCAGPDGGRECARTCFAAEGEGAPLRWGLRAAYFRRLLATAERIICPSGYVAAYFGEHLGRLAGAGARLRVIPNGIPAVPVDRAAPVSWRGERRLTLAGERGRMSGERRAARSGGEQRLTLAFLGAVDPHKGIHVILQALRLANLGPVELRLLGKVADYGYAGELRQRAALVPGLELRLYGAYAPSELPDLLHDVDCVVAPSLWPETFSITAREALAGGIPILVSRLGALPEAVTEGINGFTFDPERPGQLAALLERLASDAELLPSLREGARASRVLSAADHAGLVRAVYAEAIEERMGNVAARRGDSEELAFLHEACLRLGVPLAG